MRNFSPLIRGVQAILLLSMSSGVAFASGPPTPAPTLSHELFLIVTGAVLGGLLGPILQIIDSWLGVTPGARQQKENYEVQREIAASLVKLVAVQQPPVSSPPLPLPPEAAIRSYSDMPNHVGSEAELLTEAALLPP